MSINVTGIFLPTTTITVRPQLSTPTKERKMSQPLSVLPGSVAGPFQTGEKESQLRTFAMHLVSNRGNMLSYCSHNISTYSDKPPPVSHLRNLRTVISCCLCTPYLPKYQIITWVLFKNPINLQVYHQSKILPRNLALHIIPE